MKFGLQGTKPTRQEIRDRAEPVAPTQPRELTPISAKPVWQPTRNPRWQMAMARCRHGFAPVTLGRKDK